MSLEFLLLYFQSTCTYMYQSLHIHKIWICPLLVNYSYFFVVVLVVVVVVALIVNNLVSVSTCLKEPIKGKSSSGTSTLRLHRNRTAQKFK